MFFIYDNAGNKRQVVGFNMYDNVGNKRIVSNGYMRDNVGNSRLFFSSVQLPAGGLSSSVSRTAAACTAYLEFRTDGWVWRRNGTAGGTDQQYYQWLPGGVTSDYQVRATAISGAGLTAGPTVFTTISGPVAFTRTSGAPNAPQVVNFTIEIQRVAAPGVVVATCPASMSAENMS